MRPPTGRASSRTKIWKLSKAVYGVVYYRRLWQLTINCWLAKNGLNEIPGLPQMFIQRDDSGYLCALIDKVVDDFLIVVLLSSITTVIDNIQKRFKVVRVIRDTDIIFCRILICRRKYGPMTLDMKNYWTK